MFIAYLLIGSGILFLLGNLGLLPIRWDIVWPLILIGAGLYLLEISRRFYAKLGGFWRFWHSK